MKYYELTGEIIRHAMTVHSKLGPGFPEKFYQKALAIEMNFHKMEFKQEFEMDVHYREIYIGSRRVDFIVINSISVELKALSKLEPGDFVQAKNYLELFNVEVGLLINFGAPSLQFHRFNNSKYKNPAEKKISDCLIKTRKTISKKSYSKNPNPTN